MLLKHCNIKNHIHTHTIIMSSNTKTIISLSIVGLSLGLIFNNYKYPILSCLGFAFLGAVSSFYLIPRLGPMFINVGLKGKDLLKIEQKVLPETMGAVVGLIYMFCMFLFIPFMFYQYLVTETSGAGNRDEGVEIKVDLGDPGVIGRTLSKFPHNKLAGYLSAILSLQSTLILGVADDLFDIRWRHKFFLPAIAAIPLLIVYYVDFGVTRVIIPQFFHRLMGWFGIDSSASKSIDLGIFYYGYMAAVAIFCPNSINIYAGINGLEVGQSFVLGICILMNDFLYLLHPHHLASESHLLSVYLVLPFLGVTSALLYYNWWPAQVFVGDTYCYLAGMVFAVVGILGHFAKTVLLLFLPQIFNFAYSVPQLFNIVECPRHRMPFFNKETGLLEPSVVEFKKQPHPVIAAVLKFLGYVKLLGVYYDEKDPSKIRAISNMTVINLALVLLGPMREDQLAKTLLCFQAGFGIAAVVVRHTAAVYVFGYDNI